MSRFANVRKKTVPAMAGVMAIAAVVGGYFWINPPGAASALILNPPEAIAKEASLPGPFPSVDDVASRVTHIRTVVVPEQTARNEGEAPADQTTTDSWFSPANSAYRYDHKVGEVLTVEAFDGLQYWGYRTDKNAGYRFSSQFVLENLQNELPVSHPNVAQAERASVLDAIAKGELVQTGEDSLGGRAVLVMKDTSGRYVQLVVDKATSLPLVREQDDATVYMDYELLDPASNPEALFDPAFASGSQIVTEDTYFANKPKDLSLSELGGQTQFTLLSPGAAFGEASLVKSELLPDGNAQLTYKTVAADGSETTFLLMEWSVSKTEMTDTFKQGMEGIEAKPTETGPNGQWTLHIGGVGGPVLSLAQGNTFVAVTKVGGTDADSASLIELASGLMEVR